jgi:two-component sensor histidine kinase/ABC-type amino acid transport substrate-binding protein
MINKLLWRTVLFILSVFLLASSAEAEQVDISADAEVSEKFLNTLSAQERAWLKEHPVVTVAYDSGWPPVEFLNEKGEPSGMSQDYLEIIRKLLGIKFTAVKGPSWNELFARLKRHEIDMTTCVAATPDRKEFWAFTRPYLTIPIVIATQLNVTYIAEMHELSGQRVAVVDDYALEEWISKDFPEIVLIPVKTPLEGLEKLQRGEVYAYLDNLLIIGDYQAKMKVYNIKIAGHTPYVNAQSMAVRKDWGVLAGIIQKALDSIPETEKKDIYRKWLPVRYEYGFNYKLFWQILAGFLVIIFALVFWNWKLAREVRSRKQAEKTLSEKDELIHSISNNIQSGMIYQAVINKDGSRKFTYLSGSVKLLYGISPEEGMADPMLIYGRVNEEDRGRLAEEEEYAIKTLSTFKTEIRMKDPAGEMRWSSFVSIPRVLKNGLICFDGIEFDITEQKKAQERINMLLKEKELLLQEVHHRIKNNMNTIKGLLALQITAEENPSAAASLRDAESRVQSMIMLYDRLYFTENYREMSVKDYLQSLADEIAGSFPNRSILKIETDIEDFILNVNLLTPLGIIVNELITNMMKYAFPGRDSGVLIITAASRNDHVKIAVQDNGVGIPESVDFHNSSGFGLELVSMLTEQIGGNIRIERNEGTKFILEFDV